MRQHQSADPCADGHLADGSDFRVVGSDSFRIGQKTGGHCVRPKRLLHEHRGDPGRRAEERRSGRRDHASLDGDVVHEIPARDLGEAQETTVGRAVGLAPAAGGGQDIAKYHRGDRQDAHDDEGDALPPLARYGRVHSGGVLDHGRVGEQRACQARKRPNEAC